MIDNKAKKVFFDIGAKYFSTTVMSYVLWIVKKVKENKNDNIQLVNIDSMPNNIFIMVINKICLIMN